MRRAGRSSRLQSRAPALKTFDSGSVAHGTVNKPVSGADRGVVLDRRTYPELGPDGIQPGRIEPQNVVQAETAFARPATSSRGVTSGDESHDIPLTPVLQKPVVAVVHRRVRLVPAHAVHELDDADDPLSLDLGGKSMPIRSRASQLR